MASIFAADAFAGYFAAARQFMWTLPAIAILAAAAIERHRRAAVVLLALFGLVCIRQSVTYFTAPHENWEAAAGVVADRVKDGACLVVAPADSARLYQFFRPELALARCQGPRMVLAITPFTTRKQRDDAVAALTDRGYLRQDETSVGRSEILGFRHMP